jgi:hypothetical protein
LIKHHSHFNNLSFIVSLINSKGKGLLMLHETTMLEPYFSSGAAGTISNNSFVVEIHHGR